LADRAISVSRSLRNGRLGSPVFDARDRRLIHPEMDGQVGRLHCIRGRKDFVESAMAMRLRMRYAYGMVNA
jgi:hypothetical protein